MGETAREPMVNQSPSASIVLLGAGRVATHLAPALIKAGHRIVQIYSRTIDAARTLASPLGVPYTADMETITTEASIYIACVADEALPSIAQRLVDRVNAAAHSFPLFLHTAGSVSINLWHEAGAKHYGILYPLQTFSKERTVDMREVALFVEGSDETSLQAIEQLAHSISNKVHRADSSERALLHISAVFACNFTNAMYSIADQLLKQGGIPFDVLLPLIDETAAKVHTLAPREAQTGPAVRGDNEVMKHHLARLANQPKLQQLYAQISAIINNQYLPNS